APIGVCCTFALLGRASGSCEPQMMTVTIRRQGGAAVMTIPSKVLRQLDIDVGSTLELEVANGALTLRPAGARARYRLPDLLQGTSPKLMSKLNAETAWARDGKPVGRELA